MKKSIIIYLSILISVFIVLSLFDIRGEYAAEKAMWRINQKFGRITKDPDSIPEAEFKSVIKNYLAFKNKYSYSKLAPIAHLLAARVYLAKKDYVKAREVYEEIIKAYKNNPNICAQAIFEIGESYNRENNFQNMVAALKRLIKEYPLTDLGFQAPISLAELCIKKGDLELGQKYLNEAIFHYNALILKYKEPSVVFNAKRSVVICYMALKQWNKALDTLSEILMKFPETKYLNAQRADKIISSINMITITKLKNYDLPIGIYQDFIDKYPKHPYRNALEAMIKSLKLLKEKDVNLTTK